MTDARLKGEWLTAAAHDGLSDQAYRVLHNALMHCAEQGTDGALAARELRFLYPGALDPAWLAELEEAGFWRVTADGYQFVDWAGRLGQSRAADVDAMREANRNRKRRQRERQGGENPSEAPPAVPRGADEDSRLTGAPSQRESRALSRRDVTAAVGQAGQDRPVLPTDLIKPSTRQSPPDRARVSTDAIEVSDMTRRLAGQKGITSLRAVVDAVWHHTGVQLSADRAFQLSMSILDRASKAPDAPQRYVLAAIAQSPAEIQKQLYEEVA